MEPPVGNSVGNPVGKSELINNKLRRGIMDYILHCIVTMIETLIGGFFVLFGISMFLVGAYWFNRMKFYVKEAIQKKHEDNFFDDEEEL
jgi:hypothetical protein